MYLRATFSSGFSKLLDRSCPSRHGVCVDRLQHMLNVDNDVDDQIDMVAAASIRKSSRVGIHSRLPIDVPRSTSRHASRACSHVNVPCCVNLR